MPRRPWGRGWLFVPTAVSTSYIPYYSVFRIYKVYIQTYFPVIPPVSSCILFTHVFSWFLLYSPVFPCFPPFSPVSSSILLFSRFLQTGGNRGKQAKTGQNRTIQKKTGENSQKQEKTGENRGKQDKTGENRRKQEETGENRRNNWKMILGYMNGSYAYYVTIFFF